MYKIPTPDEVEEKDDSETQRFVDLYRSEIEEALNHYRFGDHEKAIVRIMGYLGSERVKHVLLAIKKAGWTASFATKESWSDYTEIHIRKHNRDR